MKLTKTLLTTAAAVMVLSSGALAEGYTTNSGSSAGANTSTQGSMNDTTDMNSDVNTNTSANTNVPTDLDTNTVEQVQASLRNEGYSISRDGIWGPRTADALRQFQQENGLSVTGTVNAETLAALEINQ